MDRLEAMSVLLAVVEEGSLSAGARRLRVPLTTVSRKVSDLERHLRTRLLTRTSRRVDLTEAGQAHEPGERPDLAEQFAVPGYRARVERLVTVAVEAFDWNCPQHITPRFTAAEIEAAVAPPHARIAELEARLGARTAETV